MTDAETINRLSGGRDAARQNQGADDQNRQKIIERFKEIVDSAAHTGMGHAGLGTLSALGASALGLPAGTAVASAVFSAAVFGLPALRLKKNKRLKMAIVLIIFGLLDLTGMAVSAVQGALPSSAAPMAFLKLGFVLNYCRGAWAAWRLRALR